MYHFKSFGLNPSVSKTCFSLYLSPMGIVEAKKDANGQCWARLILASGERVMVSVASSGVKVIKLKWGLIPIATIWASKSIVDAGEMFLNLEKPFQRPLDSIIDKIIDCDSTVDIAVRLHRSN